MCIGTMKIIFLTKYDPENINIWSGTLHYIYNKLKEEHEVEVLEFGANIPATTDYSVAINTDICRLIFIGKNWKRKGGDKLLRIYEILTKDGFPCTLTIMGSIPENEQEEDEDLTVIPHLDKSKQEDLKKLCDNHPVMNLKLD